MDDLEAIRRCQEGQRSPFRFLVERYTRVLYGTAYRITGDQALAEDLVQETFLRAWRGISSFRSGSSFKPWIVRILVNHVMSERRKRRVREEPLDEGMAASQGPEAGEELVLRKEERDRIKRAMEKLPQEQRQAIVLRYYTDLTVPQIARALGWRQGTVKSRLHRALNHLRKVLLSGEGSSSFGRGEVSP